MLRDNDRISTIEAAFFITAGTVEIGTLTVGRVLSKAVGSDAWIAYLQEHLVNLVLMFIIVKLALRFRRHEFVGYSRIIAGPVIGWLLSVILAAYWVFVSSRLLRGTAGVVRMSLLDKTPNMVIQVSLLLIALYLAWHGIEPICRISILICLAIFPVVYIMNFTILDKFKLESFLPVLENGPGPILKYALGNFGPLEQTSFFFFLIFFMNKPRKAIKAAFWAWLAIFITGIITIVVPIGVLGVEETKLRMISTVAALESVSLPGKFIERLGVVYVGMWVIIAFPTLCGLLYAIGLVLSKMFRTKNHKPFLIPAAVIIYVIANIPGNGMEAEKFFKILSPMGIFILLIMPVALYFIAVLRKVQD